MHWQIPKRFRFFLHVMDGLRRAQSQKLCVWESNHYYRAGETFTLYGAEGFADATDKSYVLLMRWGSAGGVGVVEGLWIAAPRLTNETNPMRKREGGEGGREGDV